MKNTKSKGGAGVGVSGISQNHAAYQRWVKTTHERSKYLSATFALADMKGEGSETTFHKDVRPEIKCEIYFDTGSGNKRRLLNVSRMAINYGEQHCAALLGLHAFTGCDTTSSFKGIAKLKPLKLMLKRDKYESVFAKLGESWEVPGDVMVELESFTCGMYCNTKTNSVDSLRLSLLTKKCGNTEKLDPKKTVDLTELPPCRKSLSQHIKRANYQTAVWKSASECFVEVPPVEGI